MEFKVSDEKSADNLTEESSRVKIHFSLASCKILSLPLPFEILTTMCLSVRVFLSSFYLKFIELLGNVYSCLSKNLGGF